MNKSPLYCEHANEVPMQCVCGADCYCKEHSCKQLLHKSKICNVREYYGNLDRDFGDMIPLCKRAINNFCRKHGCRPELLRVEPIIFKSVLHEWRQLEESLIEPDSNGQKMIELGGEAHKKFDAINEAEVTGKGVKIFGIPVERKLK